MTLASYPDNYPKAHAPLWLLVNSQHQSQVFDLSMQAPRCILVGSAANVDVRIDAVAPVAFYLEREGVGLRLTPAFPDPTLRIDARRAERTSVIYGQAVVEFSGQRIDLRLSSIRPELTATGGAFAVTAPPDLESLRGVTVIEPTSATTAYTPIAQPAPSGQNPTVAVLDAQRVMPPIAPAQTVAIEAARFEELRAVRLAPRCEATQLIDLGRNSPLPAHEPARMPPLPHVVGHAPHRDPPRNPSAAASSPNEIRRLRSVPSPASSAAGVEHPDCRRSSGNAALAAEEVAPTGLEPAPILVLSPSGELEIPKPAMGFSPVAQPAAFSVVAPTTGKGATTAVELSTAKPESLDYAPLTVLQPPAMPVQLGPHHFPSGDTAESKNLAQSIPTAGLMDLVRKHPVGAAGGVVAFGFVLVVFGLGLAQILGISPRAQASGIRAIGSVQPLPQAVAPPSPAAAVPAQVAERLVASVTQVEAPAPQTSASASALGRGTLVVATPVADESATLAVGHLFAGRLPEAEQVYRTLAARHPDDPTYAAAARILARRNRLECRSSKSTQSACPTVKQ